MTPHPVVSHVQMIVRDIELLRPPPDITSPHSNCISNLLHTTHDGNSTSMTVLTTNGGPCGSCPAPEDLQESAPAAPATIHHSTYGGMS